MGLHLSRILVVEGWMHAPDFNNWMGCIDGGCNSISVPGCSELRPIVIEPRGVGTVEWPSGVIAGK